MIKPNIPIRKTSSPDDATKKFEATQYKPNAERMVHRAENGDVYYSLQLDKEEADELTQKLDYTSALSQVGVHILGFKRCEERDNKKVFVFACEKSFFSLRELCEKNYSFPHVIMLLKEAFEEVSKARKLLEDSIGIELSLDTTFYDPVDDHFWLLPSWKQQEFDQQLEYDIAKLVVLMDNGGSDPDERYEDHPVLAKCLRTWPTQRYPSLNEALEAIREAWDDLQRSECEQSCIAPDDSFREDLKKFFEKVRSIRLPKINLRLEEKETAAQLEATMKPSANLHRRPFDK